MYILKKEKLSKSKTKAQNFFLNSIKCIIIYQYTHWVKDINSYKYPKNY